MPFRAMVSSIRFFTHKVHPKWKQEDRPTKPVDAREADARLKSAKPRRVRFRSLTALGPYAGSWPSPPS